MRESTTMFARLSKLKHNDQLFKLISGKVDRCGATEMNSSICPPLSDDALPWLTDAEAAKAFINSAEVVVIGFLEVRGENCPQRLQNRRAQISLQTIL